MNNQIPYKAKGHEDILSTLVRIFLGSNLSVILILLSLIIGIAALWMTPREEDPQIVVPLADVFVQFPGHKASEVEQLVATPLERMLYQIDGVEYVYSMSRDDAAIITVRFYVGQDRERSLVKLFKKLNENIEQIPAGVTSWVMKPVEIDDVPIVTFAVTGAANNSYSLRRASEEIVERLAVVPQVSRAFVIGGEPRKIHVYLSPERLRAHGLGVTDVSRSISVSNSGNPSGSGQKLDQEFQIALGPKLHNSRDVEDLVVGVFENRPVYLKDVAEVIDGPSETTNYVRHGWGAAHRFELHESTPGSVLGETALSTDNPNVGNVEKTSSELEQSDPAVVIAISKQKGANAVEVAASVIQAAVRLKQKILPDDIQIVVTRNSGNVANEKVNELVEALGVAIIIVVLLLTFGLGWREAIIVSIAVPVVFGLTLAVNYLFGYTINRVTLFAMILALGLLVDDPIVDVENIARHFAHRGKATREIVLQAVSEIRPPLISATLAVIVSFLPMFFITGMMGPYMSPMALNVPVAMAMSMLVAFTITPWLSYHVLTWRTKLVRADEQSQMTSLESGNGTANEIEGYDPEVIQQSLLYKFFRPLMLPLLKNRLRAILFLGFMGVLTFAAMGLAALRLVPLKMLPFDNKNEILFLLDLTEGTTLERTDACVREMEYFLAQQPEVIDYVSSVGTAGAIDFNGMVRHYYLRNQPFQAEVRVNFVGKKHRSQQSHAIGLRVRDELEKIARRSKAKLQIVELPPGPPVLASLVAELYGQEDTEYRALLDAANTVAIRMEREPGIVEVDGIDEAIVRKWVFHPDQAKAALSGISVAEIAQTIHVAVNGEPTTTLRAEDERHPLSIMVRLPRSLRNSPSELSQITIRGDRGQLIPLSELGSWREEHVSQTVYHKNLRRVAYVFAECVGRPPAECVIDLLADQRKEDRSFVGNEEARPVSGRNYIFNGSGINWGVPEDIVVTFSGEGEWKITVDVFRDLGLAFGAAMLMIYIILVAQTGSFLVPIVVMLAIPLTALGVMPGFFVLSTFFSQPVAEYPDPVFFTATAMIGMIALSGIVTRDSIILVDFMQQAVAAGRPLFDAILESRVVRLRPILLTAGAAMLSALPITLDPIFSGLGWSLIFGLVASTVFTLLVIPVTYWLLYAGRR